jgi:hypothetical protein
MKKAVRVIWILGIITILILGVFACSSSPGTSSPSPTADIDAIRSYADPATIITMQGLSENNRDKYIQSGTSEFKAAVTQEVFDKTATQVISKLGDFVSIEFLRIEEQDGYTIVHYKAKYAKGQQGIRMVFDKNHLVAGQWFE